MRFSLLFPLMLAGLGALTLLLGNAPAADVASAPMRVTAASASAADPARASPTDEAEPARPDAANRPAETTGPPAEPPPATDEVLPAAAEEAPPPATAIRAPTDELSAVAATPLFFMPVDGVSVAEVPGSFGDPRGSARLHEGIDIMAERGTPVRAAAPGTLRRVTNSARGGLSVTIIGDDGLRYFYTHFDSFPPGLATGQRVGLDTVIGYVGNSGNATATAPHLHFAVYRPVEGEPYSWQAFDPLPFLIDRSPAPGE